jgi:hypothetical protein
MVTAKRVNDPDAGWALRAGRQTVNTPFPQEIERKSLSAERLHNVGKLYGNRIWQARFRCGTGTRVNLV